jgi:hypothetical protein
MLTILIMLLTLTVSIAYLGMCVKVYRSHGGHFALVTFFFLVRALVPLFANWGKEHDIRWQIVMIVSLPILLASMNLDFAA